SFRPEPGARRSFSPMPPETACRRRWLQTFAPDLPVCSLGCRRGLHSTPKGYAGPGGNLAPDSEARRERIERSRQRPEHATCQNKTTNSFPFKGRFELPLRGTEAAFVTFTWRVNRYPWVSLRPHPSGRTNHHETGCFCGSWWPHHARCHALGAVMLDPADPALPAL